MNHVCFRVVLAGWLALAPASAFSQALISGRLLTERAPRSRETLALSAILCFDSRSGPKCETRSFRTWETHPAGWFRFSTDAGNHTLLFTGPNHFLRPIVLNNVFLEAGERLETLHPVPRLDFACFLETEWDPQPARAYFQTFIARGRSVTHAGFRLVHDGVDGAGPGAQNLLVSIHRRASGTPDVWPQVGPTTTVPDVDCGGPKNYLWYAGWNSGEVPITPGETYAVQVRGERDGAGFQAFWHRDDDQAADCYRIGGGNTGWQGRDLWLAVAGDGDGLRIPVNKRVQKQFGQFAGFARRWSQTYVAQGRSLAGAVLYAAVGGAQPPLSRQRAWVRVRRGGPEGAACGLEKLAIGNGNYTGDASWGSFGVAFAPGEVPLIPGQTYALEFETAEDARTIGGFVNIKRQASDGGAGFNPYRKPMPDTYEAGTAFNGNEPMPFDLDLQIIEYEFGTSDWDRATTGPNLLANGDFDQFAPETPAALEWPAPERGASGFLPTGRGVARLPNGWQPVVPDPLTRLAVFADLPPAPRHFARIFADRNHTADGALVQRVVGLDRSENYRLSGRVRSTWAVDFEHQCRVGLDPTGQTNAPDAMTIRWTTLPSQSGVFVDVLTAPVRPATNAISVWLRAGSSWKGDGFAPFAADFAEFALQRMPTAPPGPAEP